MIKVPIMLSTIISIYFKTESHIREIMFPALLIFSFDIRAKIFIFLLIAKFFLLMFYSYTICIEYEYKIILCKYNLNCRNYL